MTILDLKTKFPKSYKKIQEWGNELMEKSRAAILAQMGEEEKKAIELPPVIEITDAEIEGMIAFYPRRLYDFFDTQDVHITMTIKFSNSPKFQPVVNKEYGEDYNKRMQAEEAAFTKAFEILEGKL